MRTVLALLACAASVAFAQVPESFAGRAPLNLPAKGPLYRVTLPEAVYRDARTDLADVRVLNARGESVPIALASEPDVAREAPPPVDLPAFAVTSLEPATIASQVRVRLADGTLISVDGKSHTTPPERRTVAYLLDASALKEPIHALALDWDAGPSQEIIKVRVEASDDLRAWQPLASPVSLVRIEQGGRKLEQPRVELRGSRAKYLRVSGVDAPFSLKSARAEFAERARPADLLVKRVSGKRGEKPGDVVYDLEARLPVEALRLVPGETNSVVPATYFVRDTPDATPSWVAQATSYRLMHDGTEIESPASHIRRRAARYWIARIDPDKGGLGATLPQLEVHWRAAELVFVARGEEPFSLAFGNREAKSALLPVASVMPGYEPHAEMKLPAATVGTVTRVTGAAGAWPAWLEDVPPRKLALWALLVGAVVVLGVMAWRLSHTRI
jgi:uncharacterized protein DUF3999